LLRPRLDPESEKAFWATKMTYGSGVKYGGGAWNVQYQGSYLSPYYYYDSRAWQFAKNTNTSYQGGAKPKIISTTTIPDNRYGINPMQNTNSYASATCNQLPPIVDVVLVCADRRSMVRFDQTTATPPPCVVADPKLFVNSSQMEADLAAYCKQLDTGILQTSNGDGTYSDGDTLFKGAGIRYRVFRMSVRIQGAKWANN